MFQSSLNQDHPSTQLLTFPIETATYRYKGARDDQEILPEPNDNVDYLSHKWNEEDIWLSRSCVIHMRGTLTDYVRLENALWRSWMKTKNHLKTIPPEALNWFKDNDVTWLYGPRQIEGKKVEFTRSTSLPICYLDGLASIPKKSILKKSPSFVCSNMSTPPDRKYVQFDKEVRQIQAVDSEGDVKLDEERGDDEFWQGGKTWNDKRAPCVEGSSDYDPIQQMEGDKSGMSNQYIKDKEEDTVNNTLFGQAMYALNTFRDIIYLALTVDWKRA